MEILTAGIDTVGVGIGTVTVGIDIVGVVNGKTRAH